MGFETITGPEFCVDARIVHQLILRNVSEGLGAYTYVKVEIKK